MINKKQLRRLVDDTLKGYGLYSEASANLVYGTIIQESRGEYLRQNVENFDMDKHAIGICQVEKNTFLWLQSIYVGKYPELAKTRFEELEYNLKLSILFCRLRYLIYPDPIPEDLIGQAEYWKKVYNTYKGKGTVQEYINNFNKYA